MGYSLTRIETMSKMNGHNIDGQLYELGKAGRRYYAKEYRRNGNTFTPVRRWIGAVEFQRMCQADPRQPVYQSHGVAGFSYVYDPRQLAEAA